MKIIVTGGAGFIGSTLCRKLLSQGHDLVCVDNFSTGSHKNIADLLKNNRFNLLVKDITEPFSKSELRKTGRHDLLIHLASPASPVHYDRLALETAEVNSLGVKNSLDLALYWNAVFVFASTSEVYGNPVVHPQPEDYTGNLNPTGPRSHYSESKRFGETLSYLYLQKWGLDVRIMRIFNTYGPGMEGNDGRVISNFITQALLGRELTIHGDGHQTRSFCYLEDLVEGICRFSMKPGLSGSIINLGNPQEITVLDVANLILSLTESNSKLAFLPERKDDPARRCPDITKAKHLLDWKPKTSLLAGLTRTISYFQNSLS